MVNQKIKWLIIVFFMCCLLIAPNFAIGDSPDILIISPNVTITPFNSTGTPTELSTLVTSNLSSHSPTIVSVVSDGKIKGDPVIYTHPAPGKSQFLHAQNNFDPSGVQKKIFNRKDILTPTDKKLSTALLLETRASSAVSVRNGNASTSGLLTRTVSAHLSSTSSTAPPEKIPTGHLVYVYISLEPGYSTHIVDPLVADVTDRDEDNHLAVGWVDIQNLLILADLGGVRNVREVIPPVVNIGSVTTQGDTIHKTADVRSAYGYKGAGVKIGIISVGVNHLSSSVASGDLPSNVHVLSNTVGGDEGTAMLEIVHDMVPDAELYFHDCGSNTVAFNAAIDELKANGCTVICDDITWPTQPFFEDGIIAIHVSSILSGNQVVYVSSAGNAAQEHYQGTFTDDGSGFHNKYLYVNMPTGSSVRVFLQWDDQFGHSGNDYDLVLFDATTYAVLSSSTNSQTGTQDPLETISYINSGSSRVVEIDVHKYSGVAKTLELYIYPAGAGVYTNNIVAADSVFGHAAVPDVIAVAAVYQGTPTANEPFSSQGPVTIAYPSAVSRSKPDISGVDGVSVTGAGGFSNPFFGTSAAAPHIAAIVAQIWGSDPTLTPAQVRSRLYSTSVDLGVPGFDTIYGYGRADALAMANAGSWGRTKIGIYKDGLWALDYNGNGVWDGTDRTYYFGGPGFITVNGDWNGDGTTKIGIFNNGTWYLDYNGNGAYEGSSIDKTGSFGQAGDIPIVGDWNGDGKSKIGFYRNGLWAVDYDGNYAWDGPATDRSASFGGSGVIPVIGDWDGYGKDKIGFYQTSNSLWAFDYNGNYGWDGMSTDRAAVIGASGAIPVIGDWNSNGKAKLGFFANGLWAMDYNGNYGWDGMTDDRAALIGQTGDVPVVGDWNGDGRSKLGFYRDGLWVLDYNGNFAWDGPPFDKVYLLGQTGYLSIVGKWI